MPAIDPGEALFTPDQYRNALDKEKTDGSSDNTIIERNAMTTTQKFHDFTRRDFYLHTAETIKYYPQGRTLLHIDDWATITSTLPDGVEAIRKNDGWPFEYLEIDPKYFYNEIEITGQLGWLEPPAGIIDTAIEYTAILRLETPRAYGQVNAQQRNQSGGQKPTVSEIAQMVLEEHLLAFQRIDLIG